MALVARRPIDRWRLDRLLLGRVLQLNWLFIFLICLPVAVGCIMLYSAAGGSFDPWASRQLVRFGMGAVIMMIVALIDLRFWMRAAYPIYGVALVLLLAVDLMGFVAMGAQRWIDVGFIQLQPSELMKIALVLALARYFHVLGQEDIRRVRRLIVPVFMVLVPVALVLEQPDLGTAVLLSFGGLVMFFLAGVPLWMLGVAVGAVVGAMPLAWQFLHDYQKQRVLTFLDPGADPLGAGYHILQSQIALGSGGLTGKGFLQGSQSHLSFLPEKQTDFIFTMLAEEFGLVGSVALMLLYFFIIAMASLIALRSRHQFGRLLGLGIAATFSFYVFVNIAMVTGLVPVVGVPLPMISYGGSAMLTLMAGFGLVLNVHISRDLQLGRRPDSGRR
ncbi:MAG: rod shape-determining protein RodA [Alphaproteobacteria bacterium]|nr:rod shape-determining protein RodA [Alphaproteobacteria bacterium]